MASNKSKILTAALKLFNEKGMVNVRLQHIADDAIVSVGNLAYHFPNKDAILKQLYQALTQKQKELLVEYRVVPLFDNMDHLFRRNFELQQEYIFFYLDTLEIIRANEEIAHQHQQHINWQMSQLQTMISFNASRGAITEEPMPGVFQQLALQIWMTSDFWLTQQLVRGGKDLDVSNYLSAIWNLLVPFFTPMGKREYGQMLERPYDFFF